MRTWCLDGMEGGVTVPPMPLKRNKRPTSSGEMFENLSSL